MGFFRDLIANWLRSGRRAVFVPASELGHIPVSTRPSSSPDGSGGAYRTGDKNPRVRTKPKRAQRRKGFTRPNTKRDPDSTTGLDLGELEKD